MPLPPSDPARVLKHRRAIDVQAHARTDGPWEIEATASDLKPRGQSCAYGPCSAGAASHRLERLAEAVPQHLPRWSRQSRANNLTQNRTPVSLADPSTHPAEQAAPPLSS